MEKMKICLRLVLVTALSALFLSACTTTGTSTASKASKNSMGSLFENQSPAFSISYPTYWKKGEKRDNDYLFLKTGEYGLPNMRVSKNSTFTAAMTPEQAAKNSIQTFVQKYKATNCEILYAKEITLEDGTPAVEYEIKWKHPNVMLYTCNVQAKKGDTGITASMSDMFKVSKKNKAYLRTLAIK